ncbi:MAG TPA: FtsQ-type POTRA domain-containing protein [Candidatus Merdisoma merdipullorum]|nr:FtsQ-type POTRA domain-containing protein [Candidatus Merdisoma merdipullorum]
MMRFRKREKKERRGRGFLVAAVLVLVLLLAGALAVTLFQIREVEVTGNSFYTQQEIEDKVMTDRYSSNSLYLYLKYNYLDTEEIPFIDKIEISLLSPGKVRIRVYEKSIVGYVTYMGSNFYFDQDGVIVESSSEVKEGIPCISGLKFSSLALYQKLAVEDDAVFDEILTITQLVEKYELRPERIEFSDDLSLTLYFEQVRVALGNSGSLEEKVGRLHDLYPDLEGRAGVFHMENYTEDSKFISFEQDE